MRTLGRQLFITATLVYAALFFLWRFLVGSPLYGAWGWLQVSDIFAMAGYLPAPLLLPGAIAFRSRWALLGLAAPFLWFSLEYGALFLPNTPPSQEGEAQTLRVMTWNTGNSIGYYGQSAEGLKSVAEKLQPEIILLQEVGPEILQQTEVLAEGWPYQRSGLAGRRRQAIVSKLPILAETANDNLHGCQCRHLTLAWNEQPIDVVAIHVSIASIDFSRWHGLPVLREFDATVQNATFDALLTGFAGGERPLIIAGDFNTTERQPNYARLLEAGLHNAHADSGWGLGLTFPRPGIIRRWFLTPLIRIDHLFYNDQWDATRTWTGMISSSDHLYVVTDLQLQLHSWHTQTGYAPPHLLESLPSLP